MTSIGKCLYDPQTPFCSTLKNRSFSRIGAKSFSVYFLPESASTHLDKCHKIKTPINTSTKLLCSPDRIGLAYILFDQALSKSKNTVDVLVAVHYYFFVRIAFDVFQFFFQRIHPCERSVLDFESGVLVLWRTLNCFFPQINAILYFTMP